jgi:hypothetical protein
MNLGLDRIVSHTDENCLCNIWSICYGVNRVVTVVRRLGRFELAGRLLSELSIQHHISKRGNLGGVSLRLRSELEFSLDGRPAGFAIELLLAAGIPLREIAHLNPHPGLLLDPDAHIPKSFSDQIYALMHEGQLPEKFIRVRTSTQGR